MPLGIDFNPTAPRVTKPPPKPRDAPCRPVRVQESRLPASEAKPRPGMPRAFAEENATSRRVLAEVSRPPPAVHWILPMDKDDGRLHPVPTGGAGTIDVDAAFEEARAKAQKAFDRHQIESDYIRNTAAPNNVKAIGEAEQKIADDFNARNKEREGIAEREAIREGMRAARAVRRGVTTAPPTRASDVRSAQVPVGGATRSRVARREFVQERVSEQLPRLSARASAAEERAVTLATRRGAPTSAAHREASAEEEEWAPRREGEDTPPPFSRGKSGREPPQRERRLASAINWRTEPHINIPAKGADRLHDDLAGHLAKAEAELATMGRASRAKTQLSEKVEYLKTQVARMAGKGGLHPVAANLQKHGLSADDADRARKLGFEVDGSNLKQHGQFRDVAYLRRALDEADAGAAGSGEGGGGVKALRARAKELEDIGGMSPSEAFSMSFKGITVKKFDATERASARTLYYADGKQISKAEVWKLIKADEEREVEDA